MDINKKKWVLRYSSDSDEEEICEKVFPDNTEKLVLRYSSDSDEEIKEKTTASIGEKSEEYNKNEFK